MRILHVISSLNPALGGPAAAVLPMAGALVRFGGLKVTVVGGVDKMQSPLLETAARAGVDLKLHPIPRHGSRLGRVEMSPQFMAGLVRSVGDFDLVHTHGIFTLATATVDSLRRFARKPFVMRPCGALDGWSLGQGSRLKKPFLAAITLPTLRSAAFVHCTSEAEAEAVRRLEAGANAQVIPHGIDLEPYQRVEAPASERPYLLFLARLHHKKGLDLLLPAFALISRHHTDLDLVIAGPDEGMASTVKALAEAEGISSRVRLVGPVYGAEKVRWLAGASAFVLPSRQENFGISAVEAAAAGAPLVVSDGVAIHGEVAAAGAGVVSSLEVPALASAITQVLSNRATYAHGARRFAAAYSLETMARRLTELYGRAL